MNKNAKIILSVLFILLAVSSRLVKHPYNFTPIIALTLFSGCYLRRYWTFILPFTAMLLSDYFIGFYDWQVMASVYFSIAIAFLIGRTLYSTKKWYFILSSAIFSSILFFIITNFAVWAFFSWYPHTWQGLSECFTLAIPFFRNSLLGDILYTGVIFSTYELTVLAVNKTLVKVKGEAI